MKKIINQKEMNRIAKTALAMVLAGSFTFSSSLAFANDDTTTVSKDVQAVTAPSESLITNDAGVTTNATVEVKVETEAELKEPTLVPGDLFYFAKLIIEKVQLMLTADDVKEAKLLATFASERLAEAEKLFTEGKEDLALKTIEKALADMKIADSVVVEEQTGTIPAKVEEEKPATEVQAKEEDTTVTQAPTNDEEVVKEVEKLMSQNIIALTAAMEKVQNPVAKAALQKNIDKSYAKLEKKIAKIEASLTKEEEEEADAKQETTVVSEKEVEGSTEVKVEAEATESDTAETKVEEKTTTVVAPVIEVKTEEKKDLKAVKEKVEKQKKQAKKEVKVDVEVKKGKSEEKKNEKK